MDKNTVRRDGAYYKDMAKRINDRYVNFREETKKSPYSNVIDQNIGIDDGLLYNPAWVELMLALASVCDAISERKEQEAKVAKMLEEIKDVISRQDNQR